MLSLVSHPSPSLRFPYAAIIVCAICPPKPLAVHSVRTLSQLLTAFEPCLLLQTLEYSVGLGSGLYLGYVEEVCCSYPTKLPACNNSHSETPPFVLSLHGCSLSVTLQEASQALMVPSVTFLSPSVRNYT
jgi:hypothetical protein